MVIDCGSTTATGSSRPARVQAEFRKHRSRRLWLPVVLVVTTFLASACTTPWLQFGGGSSHQNDDTSETALTLSNVSALHQVWQVTLPATADGVPIVTTAVVNGQFVDLVIVLTLSGDLVARNLADGSVVWSLSFPAPPGCIVTNFQVPCYIPSSPVVIGGYVYTYGLDGMVHKVGRDTGIEITTGGWPVMVTAKPTVEKGSSSLSYATAADDHTYLYMTTASWGDQNDYQGHVVAIDVASGASHVFNVVCSDQTVLFQLAPATPDCPAQQGGVWARPGTTYDPQSNRLFIVSGNADFDAARHDWGDTVIALHPDGTGVTGDPVDTFTPTDYQRLDDDDLDLGSTLPAIVPAPSGSAYTDLGVQGGKSSTLYLLDLADLSRQGGPGHLGGELQSLPVPQGGQVLSQPAVWTNPADGSIWVFVGTSKGISGLTVDLGPGGLPVLTPRWQRTDVVATTPLVADGVLFAAGGGQSVPFFPGPGSMEAMDPTTGASVWSTVTGTIHWESPVVSGGYLLLSDNAGHLTAWHR